MPESLVTTERSVFLSMSLMLTATPGTTAPVGSVTLPVTSAELVAWPHASDAYIRPVDKASPLRRDSVFMVPSRKCLQLYGRCQTMSSDACMFLVCFAYCTWVTFGCANRLHVYRPDALFQDRRGFGTNCRTGHPAGAFFEAVGPIGVEVGDRVSCP